jgi:NADH:ubiquinone oxidoreductase subunit F (NADH-binding)/NADH:ubiquinone oxidoreductase subunit E/NAD-dependent dihydropyrimidine dehydrogenase PreA subunit
MNRAALENILERYQRNPQQIIAILHALQDQERYLPEEDLLCLAKELRIPASQLFQISTFYKAFSLKPRGKHQCHVCMGTACHVRGAALILEEVERKLGIKSGETTPDLEFSLDRVNCLGACALAPIVVADGEYFGNMSAPSVGRMLRQVREGKAQKPRKGAKPKEEGAPPETSLAPKVIPFFSSPAELSRYRTELVASHNPDLPCLAVCRGTGCSAMGSGDLYLALKENIEANSLGDKVCLNFTGCHGLCEKGPLMVVFPEEIFYTSVRPQDAEEVLSKVLEKSEPVERLLYREPGSTEKIVHESEVPFFKRQKRLLIGNNRLINPESIDDYLRIGGYSALPKALSEMTPEQVIAEIQKAGLRGRGGGGFPAGLKWETCRNAHGQLRYVIINADEGDPGAFMDRSVLEGNPHSVLEGLIIAAYAIAYGVSPVQGFIYVRHEYPLALKFFTHAVEQARACGLLGKNILGKQGFDFDVQVSQGGGAFVCGESSALMASIEGKPGEPRAKYVHTVHKGIHNQPSNLNNVETYANVPLIINHGAGWYSSMGTANSKGTKIFSLVGKINRTGLVEVPMGITLREIVYDIGGGIPNNKKFKAVQTGGPSGGCLPESLLHLPVDFDELTKVGSMMGSGGMIIMDEDTCMVDVARYFLNFLLDESCGKCTPCREGVKQILSILNRVCEGQGKEGDIERLVDLGNAVQDSSLCALGGSAANPLLTTIKYFEDEYVAHIRHKRCPAGVCKALIEYSIDPEKCTGCKACVKLCPRSGISGDLKKPHWLDKQQCIKCGICFEICKFDAVVRRSVGV